MFLLYEASEFAEYADSLNLSSSGVFALFYCIIMMQRRANVLEFLKSIEIVIDKRE